jgi:hypothetical protein
MSHDSALLITNVLAPHELDNAERAEVGRIEADPQRMERILNDVQGAPDLVSRIEQTAGVCFDWDCCETDSERRF